MCISTRIFHHIQSSTPAGGDPISQVSLSHSHQFYQNLWWTILTYLTNILQSVKKRVKRERKRVQINEHLSLKPKLKRTASNSLCLTITVIGKEISYGNYQ